MNEIMNGSGELTFPSLFGKMVKDNGEANALSFLDEEALTYSEVDRRIRAVWGFLEQLEIRPGDRVAILSSNMPNWGISF